MILHYLKVALRNLRKNKTQHLISALCLAIGILTFSFMLCFVYTVGEEEEYIGGERAMRLMISKKDFAGDVPCVEEDFRALKSQTSGMLEGWAVFSYEAEMEVEVVEKDGRETPYKVTYKVATPATFPFWKLPLLYGSRLPEREDEIIVSASFARRMAGSENPVGRIVRLASLTPANGITDYRIVNVVAEKEKGGSPRTECWFPLEMKPRTWLQMYALSKEGVSSESLEKYLAGISWVRGDGTMIVEASSLKEMAENRNTDLVQFFLLFISSLILVSGLINFLKFTFQQFYVRQRELALRKCVGSGSKGLFLLLFFEVFIMLTIAWFLSLLMGEVVMPLARTWLPAEHIFWLSASAVYRLHILVYLGTLLLCIPLLLIPVWRVRKVSLIRLIPVTGGKHVFRSLMIGIQLVVCIFFLGAMMVVHLSYAELFGKTYAPLSPAEEERCLSLSVNSERMRQNWDEIRSGLTALPGIERLVTLGDETLDRNQFSYLYTSYEKADHSKVSVTVAQGDPAYFDFFRIPMDGKPMEADTEGYVYICQSFSDLLQTEQTDGTVVLDGRSYRIAGVYPDLYKQVILDGQANLSVFFPSSQAASCLLKIAPGNDVDQVTEQVITLCRRYVPETLPLEIHRLTDVRQTQAATIGMMKSAMGVLALICVLLVVLSVYSSVTMDAEARRKEVAIRKINGASPRDIGILFARGYVVIFLVAFVVTYPVLRLAMIQTLSDSGLQSVYGWGWGVCLFFVIACLIGMTTCWQILRIMRLNPVEEIKRE